MAVGLKLSILSGAQSPAWSGEPGDVFAPIQASTAADPAGAQLMIISITLLFMLVLSIFGGTMYYMFKDKEKQRRRQAQNNPTAQEKDSVAESESQEPESSQAPSEIAD